MKKVVTLSSLAFLSTLCFADAPVQEQIDALKKEILALQKTQKRAAASISEVKKATGGDNIKFGLDFRNAIDMLEYKDNDNDLTAKNPSLLTSRLYLTMGAAPMDGLIFQGKLAIYSTWGAHIFDESAGLKDWSASSRTTDTIMRIKEAYFVYSNSLGEQPVSFSIGRRPSTNGALANYRENEPTAGSPLAHITNMEVNAAMVKLDWDRFIPGAYTKFVYGRAHTGEAEGAYGENPAARFPYADKDTIKEDENVDFFVMPGDAYSDGQYQVMYQWAHIFDTKGKNMTTSQTAVAAGSADLFSLGLKVDGIGNEISDFLDATTFFISGAYTTYSPKSDNYVILSTKAGESASGQSLWAGVIIPDMITESGRLGFEYNQGSKHWTPMTWAEDTAIGSKIAVRGSAYEAYWNFDLFGVKYLPAQVRYTYVQHDYTPNINCAGWVAPVAVDIIAQDLRLTVSYRY